MLGSISKALPIVPIGSSFGAPLCINKRWPQVLIESEVKFKSLEISNYPSPQAARDKSHENLSTIRNFFNKNIPIVKKEIYDDNGYLNVKIESQKIICSNVDVKNITFSLESESLVSVFEKYITKRRVYFPLVNKCK